jgi:hypothetical protein
MPGITNKIFSSYNSVIYTPTTSSQFASSAGKPSAPQAIATPVPSPASKKAAAASAKKGLFNGYLPRPKKALPILAGQKALDFSGKGAFLKPPERKITEKKEGFAEIHIKHKVKISGLSTQKGSIGSYVMIKPRCLLCGICIDGYTPGSDEEEAPAFCDNCLAASKIDPTFKPLPAEDLRVMNKEHSDWVNHLWNICTRCQNVGKIEDLRECGTWEVCLDQRKKT